MEKEELYNMYKSIIELHKHFFINSQVTAQYINYYKEQNDPEGIMFGNKVEIKVKEEETK